MLGYISQAFCCPSQQVFRVSERVIAYKSFNRFHYPALSSFYFFSTAAAFPDGCVIDEEITAAAKAARAHEFISKRQECTANCSRKTDT
ncbi:MAG: hypothetical protein LBT44_07310 [Clostridiales bacterium]|nr:hypothetical protein [Clostridiales bacterium]